MKIKSLLIIISLIILSVVNGRAQSKNWFYHNTASSGQCAVNSYSDMVFDNSGNTYAVGINLVNYSGFCFRQPNIIVHKFNSAGAITATYEYDYNNLEEDDIAVSLRLESSTGRLFVLGYSHQFMILIKLNTSLVFQTEKRFYDFYPRAMAVGFNNVFIAGNTADGAAILRYKTNTMSLVGYNLYEGGTVNDGDITPDGFAITGRVPTVSNGNALFVARYDSLLNLSWAKNYNRTTGNYQDEGLKLRVVNNNIIVGGNTQNASVSNIGMVIKYNSSGVQQWTKLLANSPAANDYASFTDLTGDPYAGDIYALGYKTGNRLYRYNSGGTKLLDSTVTNVSTGTFSTQFKSIANNGSGSAAATKLFLAGTTSYSNGLGGYYERCITYWTNQNGVFIYSDFDQPGGFDPSFGYTLGKINKLVNPYVYVAVGNGRTEVSNPQASGSVGIIVNYATGGPQPRNATEATNDAFSVLPNPASNRLMVNSQTEMQSYEVMDMNGKILQREIVAGRQAVISLDEIHDGIYLIRIHTPDGCYTRRFIKENGN